MADGEGPTDLAQLMARVEVAREAQARHHAAHPDRVPDPYGDGQPLTALAMRRQALERGWGEAVPGAYGDPTLEDFGTDLRKAVAPWAMAPHGTLLITGPVGTGKSHLGWAAVRPSWFDGLRVWAGSASALVNGLRPDGSGAYRRTWDRVTAADLVYLDDLGAERQTEWSADQIAQVIHTRWENDRPMIVTTNLEPKPDLRDHLGERTYSRLTADLTPVRLTGDDRRRKTT